MNRFSDILSVLFFALTLTLIPFLFQNCKLQSDDPDTSYKPVFISRADLEKSVVLTEPQTFTSPGKIFLKPPYLFVNKPGFGYYVFDNTNPASPTNIAFISAPATFDMAIKNNTLYIDNAVDLVVLEYIPTTSSLTVKKRFKKKFREPLPPDANEIPSVFNSNSRRGDSVIIGWAK